MNFWAKMSEASIAGRCQLPIMLQCRDTVPVRWGVDPEKRVCDDRKARNSRRPPHGCEIEAVVVDPASDWPLFAEKARELVTVHDVDVIFDNWTSVSRKSVLPVIEELNGLLFYPVQYEGEEISRNVFYTDAAPNQQAIPATDYYLDESGVEKFALLQGNRV